MSVDDPGYEGRLEGLGSSTLVRAMRWGDWDVIEGAFFDCWDPQRHVLRPFTIPTLGRARAPATGAAPSLSRLAGGRRCKTTIARKRGYGCRVVAWFATANSTRQKDDSGVSMPNVGLKWHAVKVGEELEKIEAKLGKRPTDGVLDRRPLPRTAGRRSPANSPAALVGVSIGARPTTSVAQRGAMAGWDQVRARLEGDADGGPMIACFNTCVDSIERFRRCNMTPTTPKTSIATWKTTLAMTGATSATAVRGCARARSKRRGLRAATMAARTAIAVAATG